MEILRDFNELKRFINDRHIPLSTWFNGTLLFAFWTLREASQWKNYHLHEHWRHTRAIWLIPNFLFFVQQKVCGKRGIALRSEWIVNVSMLWGTINIECKLNSKQILHNRRFFRRIMTRSRITFHYGVPVSRVQRNAPENQPAESFNFKTMRPIRHPVIMLAVLLPSIIRASRRANCIMKTASRSPFRISVAGVLLLVLEVPSAASVFRQPREGTKSQGKNFGASSILHNYRVLAKAINSYALREWTIWTVMLELWNANNNNNNRIETKIISIELRWNATPNISVGKPARLLACEQTHTWTDKVRARPSWMSARPPWLPLA